MSLKLTYYGQNDGSTVPDVALTGDPGTDQALLTAAGYLGGRIMALSGSPAHATNVESVIVPCNTATMVPYATLINGPGEFSGAIGPSGSRKAPVVRALWQGIVDSDAFDANHMSYYTVGAYLYCGTTALAGYYVSGADEDTSVTSASGLIPVAICTHKPTASEPWLGVASLL